jgi:hypothetical protein
MRAPVCGFAGSRRVKVNGVPIMVAIGLSAPSACANAGLHTPSACGAARLKNVGQLYRATGLPPEAADAPAFPFFCFILSAAGRSFVRPRWHREAGFYPFSFLLHSL